MHNGNIVQSKDSCGNVISSGGNADKFSACVKDAGNYAAVASAVSTGHLTEAQKCILTIQCNGEPINGGANTVINIDITAGTTPDLGKSTVVTVPTSTTTVGAGNVINTTTR